MTSTHPRPDSQPPDPRRGDDRIQSPHDRLLNQTLQQIESARVLLARHLPSEIVQHLKLDTLAPADTSLIDRNLRRRLTDRLFAVEVSEAMVRDFRLQVKYVHLLVLVDHKSTDEPQTLLQMLGYIVRLWENALDNKRPLVPILPWVIYNGTRPWQAPRKFNQLIPVPESWKRYMVGLELPILDVSRMDDGSMAGEPFLQVAFTLLKYGRDLDLETVLRSLFQTVSTAISPQQAENLLDTIRVYVMSVNPTVGDQQFDELVTEFWPVRPEPGSVADQLIKKGEAQGEVRGAVSEKIKSLRMLQSMLGTPLSTDEELTGQSLEALQTIIDQLQQQIVQRLR